MEGWASRMWEWYTGILIWKTQNPWTSLRGQMYDWFLDVNASFYGTKKGCEPLHPQYNIVGKQVELVNTALSTHRVSVKASLYKPDGSTIWEKIEAATIKANSVNRMFSIPLPEDIEGVYFLKLELEEEGRLITDNIYWLTTTPKNYRGLADLPQVKPEVKATLEKEGDQYTGTILLTADKNISFFNRLKVFDKESGKRILPVHYSDNYITLMPGDKKEIQLQFSSRLAEDRIEIVIDSWTSERLICPITR